MAKKKNKDTEDQPTKKKRSRIRTLFKWARRISFVAGIVGAIRKYQMDQNEANKPPTV